MKERPKKRAIPLTEAVLVNRRGSATQFWSEIINVRGVTVEEKARALAAVQAKPERKMPSHVLRKLLLDLVVDITPLDEPVPETLIALLRDELGLPANHQVGGWPVTAGMHDDRGKPDHEARECASLVDLDYIDKHGKYMPLRTLVREVKAKLGREPDRKSVRNWRASSDYWAHRWSPPKGGGK
ncbi:hypothetical protein AB7M49_001799 [Bradyrhizobium elkanii]